METQTISVTRALAELKRLKDRIARATVDGTFVAVTIGTGTNQKVFSSNETVAETSARIQSSSDSVQGLINRYNELKSKVVISNATTLTKVANIQMTVAEAIERKTSIQMYKALLQTMRSQLAAATVTKDTANAKMDAVIESYVTTVYGAAERSKLDASLYEAVAKPQREAKQAELLDPTKIREQIAKLEEYISYMTNELDFSLSEINAQTVITVSV